MAAAMGIGRFAYTPLLPEMVTRFDWSYADAGDVASANFLGYLLGAFWAPKLAISPSVRLWVAFSLMGSVATSYLGAEISEFSMWLALRFTSGICSAFCLVILTTHLMQTLVRCGSEHLGNIHFAGVGLGIVLCTLGVLSGGSVETQWARQGFIAAFLMAGAWLFLSPGPWIVPDSPERTVIDGERVRVWPVIVGYGFFGYGYIVAATFMVAMANDLADASNFDVRSIWLVVGASTLPSVYLWQWLAQRWRLPETLMLSYVVLSAGALTAGLAESFATLMFAAVLLGGTFGAITALGLSLGRNLAPHRVAQVVSAMTIAFSLGQLLGPAVSGRLADLLGGFAYPSAIAALLLAAAACLVPLAYKSRVT